MSFYQYTPTIRDGSVTGDDTGRGWQMVPQCSETKECGPTDAQQLPAEILPLVESAIELLEERSPLVGFALKQLDKIEKKKSAESL